MLWVRRRLRARFILAPRNHPFLDLSLRFSRFLSLVCVLACIHDQIYEKKEREES